MSPSTVARERISGHRAAVTLGFVVFTAVLWTADGPPSFSLGLLLGATTLFWAVSVFDAVRAHPLYRLSASVCTAIVFGALAVASTGPGLTFGSTTLLAALTTLCLLGVVVEWYNYRNGTAYLRIDRAAEDGR